MWARSFSNNGLNAFGPIALLQSFAVPVFEFPLERKESRFFEGKEERFPKGKDRCRGFCLDERSGLMRFGLGSPRGTCCQKEARYQSQTERYSFHIGDKVGTVVRILITHRHGAE